MSKFLHITFLFWTALILPKNLHAKETRLIDQDSNHYLFLGEWVIEGSLDRPSQNDHIHIILDQLPKTYSIHWKIESLRFLPHSILLLHLALDILEVRQNPPSLENEKTQHNNAINHKPQKAVKVSVRLPLLLENMRTSQLKNFSQIQTLTYSFVNILHTDYRELFQYQVVSNLDTSSQVHTTQKGILSSSEIEIKNLLHHFALSRYHSRTMWHFHIAPCMEEKHQIDENQLEASHLATQHTPQWIEESLSRRLCLFYRQESSKLPREYSWKIFELREILQNR
jgi:hypothetical protein